MRLRSGKGIFYTGARWGYRINGARVGLSD